MIRLFRVFVPTSVVALVVSEVILIFACFIIATYLIVDSDPQVFLLYDGGLSRITLVVVSVLLGLYFQDLYNDFRIRSKTLLIQQLCLVIGLVFFSQALLTYVNRDCAVRTCGRPRSEQARADASDEGREIVHAASPALPRSLGASRQFSLKR